MTALDLLFDALADYRADHSMAKRGPVPTCSIAYTVQGGSHSFCVFVDGEEVVLCVGASIEGAARKTVDAFRAWHEDQSEYIEHALEVSIAGARR